MKLYELLASVPDACRDDARYLISDYLSCSITDLSVMQHTIFTETDMTILKGWLEKLTQGEPPQYISGRAWFMGHEFVVSPAVLIPRMDTEVLVESLSRHLKGQETILEIGTGSGIIAISLGKLHPDLILHATDISPAALEIARQNAKRLDTKVLFFETDLYPDTSDRYDVIISNPPYISTQEFSELEPRVKDHEPRQALWGGDDGLEYYRRILEGLDRYLNPGGLIALEHGYDQQQALTELAGNWGLNIYERGKDLAGNDRYLILKK
ncbi:MAG TPA: peptide chain release factor N(5)-glutamine methyltransferase [Candidatus Cloacimonadota bacterium]|nr:peptide chain release factor N(5)-glutamine methyltransferase [Candidatus Cloacimonadota bacterium]